MRAAVSCVANFPLDATPAESAAGHRRPEYDITPDGERFLMIKEGGAAGAPSQIIVVENWFEELRQRVPVN